MKKISLVLFILLVLPFALADGDHAEEIAEGKEIVRDQISCDQLSDEQLESIGEYFMEQMHPGSAHNAMHQHMGIEEGTPHHMDFHVNMASAMYCGEQTGGQGGMTPMMRLNNMMGQGSMMYSNYTTNNYFKWLVFGLIILIAYLIGTKTGKKKRR